MDRSLFRIDSSSSCCIDGCSYLGNDISQCGNAISPIPRVATSDIDDSFVNDNITCTVEDTCRRGRSGCYVGIDYDGSINYSYTSISRCGLYRIIDCQICLCSNSNIRRGNCYSFNRNLSVARIKSISLFTFCCSSNIT